MDQSDPRRYDPGWIGGRSRMGGPSKSFDKMGGGGGSGWGGGGRWGGVPPGRGGAPPGGGGGGHGPGGARQVHYAPGSH